MADGTRLVADAWHPAGDGKWPVLLQRLPYGRSSASTPVLPHPAWFARRGYAVVVQDVRGCGDSEGSFEPFVDEGSDGATTIEWVAGLPFSNGDVATYGFSYQGLNQLYAAALQPPSLRAIAPMMCCPDPYEGWTYENGCLRWSFVAEWAAQLVSLEAGGKVEADLDAVPLETALGIDPPTWFREWLEHPADDAYWAARRPDLSRIHVPAFTVLGWFDDFAAGTARMIERLDAAAVCGPWAHMPWGTRLGDLEFGADASGRSAADALIAFLDRVLKGRGEQPVEKVSYYSPGSGWSSTPSWPPTSDDRQLAATSDGDANSRGGTGRLVWEHVPKGPPDVLVADAADPHPGAAPLTSEAVSEDRRDVLSYTSDPFTEPLAIAGSPSVEIEFSADRTRHHLVAALVAVGRDDEPRCISQGAVRVDHRSPGSRQPIRITMSPIAWTSDTGTRLRLDITVDRFPFVARVVAGDEDSGSTCQTTVEVLSATLRLPLV